VLCLRCSQAARWRLDSQAASPNYLHYTAATSERTDRLEQAFCGCYIFDTVQAAFLPCLQTQNPRPVISASCPAWAWENGQEGNRKKLSSRPPSGKRGKKKEVGKKGYFFPEKRPEEGFARSFVTSLFAEKEGERDFWNGPRET